MAETVCLCVYGNMMSPVSKENHYTQICVVCCCSQFYIDSCLLDGFVNLCQTTLFMSNHIVKLGAREMA